jgi:hypothetical protein
MERITIAVGGPLPGIPGYLSPGVYDIDWQQRTATPVEVAAPPSSAVLAEEAAPAPANDPPRRSLMTNGG